VQGNNLRVKWSRGIQKSEVQIICTTPHQRKAVIERIGDPMQEIVVRNYLANFYQKVPKDCKSALNKARVLVFFHKDVAQLVFPDPKIHANFEIARLGKVVNAI
jgi:hypothetical protein